MDTHVHSVWGLDENPSRGNIVQERRGRASHLCFQKKPHHIFNSWSCSSQRRIKKNLYIKRHTEMSVWYHQDLYMTFLCLFLIDYKVHFLNSIFLVTLNTTQHSLAHRRWDPFQPSTTGPIVIQRIPQIPALQFSRFKWFWGLYKIKYCAGDTKNNC